MTGRSWGGHRQLYIIYDRWIKQSRDEGMAALDDSTLPEKLKAELKTLNPQP